MAFLKLLFTSPEPGLLLAKLLLPTPTYTADTGRRFSAHLAPKLRDVPVAQMAEELVAHRLGYYAPDASSMHNVVVEYKAMYKKPLPSKLTQALNTICRIDAIPPPVAHALATLDAGAGM